MANYQIKLTPVDTFFFGGEKHSEVNGMLQSNYFVESSNYPQQTTMLGLLRYYLLLKNENLFEGKKIIDKDAAALLIGENSFNFNNKKSDFKKIVNISPLYFNYNELSYFFAPSDYDFELKDFQLYHKTTQERYNAKSHYYDICQQLCADTGESYKLDDIIKSVLSVGNEKAEKGESRDDKFYKQRSKMFCPGWSFCFDAEIGEGAGIINDLDEIFLPFGGEKSFFKVHVKKQNPSHNHNEIPNFKRDAPYIFCKSDCFIESFILQDAVLAVNNFVSFRNLYSTVKTTEKYSGLSKSDKRQMNPSLRYNLLQRGSVLYFNDITKLEKVAKQIEGQKHCQKIGFNQILTIKNPK